MTSLSAGIVNHWRKQKANGCLSSEQKSVSMTTLVSKLPRHFCHRLWHKVSNHYFFLSTSWIRYFYLCCSSPIELSCTINAISSLFELYLCLIAIYYPQLLPWNELEKVYTVCCKWGADIQRTGLIFFFFFHFPKDMKQVHDFRSLVCSSKWEMNNMTVMWWTCTEFCIAGMFWRRL